ncbi:Voltage-gated Ion Channel (VIC) Superfamily [Thraustotheca clavata]|uniref:Voltage-gated Ion Channel (VIC) Superfamily n=1 Tax=Thraustotheca clavata TaxID=74557 RepID=A0A1W0A3W3_9STRA|nr:Voltage-gated Ion Channel (VIC) Superfamily [Thraustotheca clavata]
MSLRGRRSFSLPPPQSDEEEFIVPIREIRSFDGTFTGLPLNDELELRRDIGVPLDKTDEERGDDETQMILSPPKQAIVPSAYMIRQAQKEHVVGLSPIEELKIVQGEFQARAASKYPRFTLHSRLSTRLSTSFKRTPSGLSLINKIKPPIFKRKIVPRASDIMAEADLKHTLNKDVESMTPEQALSFVKDAAKTEFILKEQAVNSQTRALPWYMLHPTGKRRIRWDVATLVLLIYTSIYTPLSVAFPANIPANPFFSIFDDFLDVFFCLDVIINFITAFEYKGILESRIRYIIINYLRTWFFIDIIGAFPFHLLLYNVIANPTKLEIKIFQLIKLLRVSRTRRALRRLDYSILVRSKVSSLIKFFILVMVTSHWFSCFFFGMSSGDAAGWVAKLELNNSTFYAQYANSFYWSIMTMTTIGYGDVTGQTTNEQLFSIFAMVNGAWIFAYGITNVVAMVSNLNSNDTQFQLKMDRINSYMEARDLPLDLRTEIREFFFNTRLSADSKLRNETKILGELSALLRSKIALAINDSVLNKMPLFEGADHNFLMELALCMKMVCFPPHEEVIIEGEIGEEMFFIFRGVVEVLQGGRQIAVLGEQQYFGEMAILNKNCLRIATVVTLCFCELRMLTRDKFLLALTHYPSMRHRIAKFVHKRNQVARMAKANPESKQSMSNGDKISPLNPESHTSPNSAHIDTDNHDSKPIVSDGILHTPFLQQHSSKKLFTTQASTKRLNTSPTSNESKSRVHAHVDVSTKKLTELPRSGTRLSVPLPPKLEHNDSKRNLTSHAEGSRRNLLGQQGSVRKLQLQQRGSNRNILHQGSTRNLLTGGPQGSFRNLLLHDASIRSLVPSSSTKSFAGLYHSNSQTQFEPDEMSTMKRITSLDISYRDEQLMVSSTERMKRMMQKVTSHQEAIVGEISVLHKKFLEGRKQQESLRHELTLYRSLFGPIDEAIMNPNNRRNTIVDNVDKHLHKSVQASSLPDISNRRSSIVHHTIQGVDFKNLIYHEPVKKAPKVKKKTIQRSRTANGINLDGSLDEEFERIMRNLQH